MSKDTKLPRDAEALEILDEAEFAAVTSAAEFLSAAHCACACGHTACAGGGAAVTYRVAGDDSGKGPRGTAPTRGGSC